MVCVCVCVSIGQHNLVMSTSIARFPVNDEMLKPLLEGLTIEQAIKDNRLFLCDLKIMEDLPVRPNFTVSKFPMADIPVRPNFTMSKFPMAGIPVRPNFTVSKFPMAGIPVRPNFTVSK